ncbi:MAG: MMPL family transporter [Armatimonadetes bacterium]|nr:MMPL family transporter [Armatimonadota bacterium]
MALRCARHPLPFLLLILGLWLAGLACLIEVRPHFEWSSLFRPEDAAWQAYRRLREAFPRSPDAVVLAESGPQASRRSFLDRLARRLEREPQHFRDVFHRLDLAPVRERALLYLSGDQVGQVLVAIEALSNLGSGSVKPIEPAALRQALPVVEHLLGQLEASLEARGRNLYSSPLARFLPDVPGPLTARDLMEEGGVLYNSLDGGDSPVLLVRPADSAGVARLRQVLAEVSRDYPEVGVQLTGLPILERDLQPPLQRELLTLGAVGAGLVLLVLFLSLERLRQGAVLVAAGLASVGLTAGLGSLMGWSAHAAALLLTLPFLAVILLGFYLWIWREFNRARSRQPRVESALAHTVDRIEPLLAWAAVLVAGSLGPPLTLWGPPVAQAAGWLLLTGIALGWLTGWTVLPALLALGSRWAAERNVPPRGGGNHTLAGIAVLVALVALAGPPARGSSSDLMDRFATRSPELRAHLQLLPRMPLGADFMVEDLEEGRRLVGRLKQNPAVGKVDWIGNFLPQPAGSTQQDVARIARLARGLSLPPVPEISSGGKLVRWARALESTGTRLAGSVTLAEAGSVPARLVRIRKLVVGLGPGALEEGLLQFAGDARSDLATVLAWLQVQKSSPLTPEHLPPALVSRLRGQHGRYLVQVRPEVMPATAAELRQFVEGLGPGASGELVLAARLDESFGTLLSRARYWALGFAFLIAAVALGGARRGALAVLPAVVVFSLPGVPQPPLITLGACLGLLVMARGPTTMRWMLPWAGMLLAPTMAPLALGQFRLVSDLGASAAAGLLGVFLMVLLLCRESRRARPRKHRTLQQANADAGSSPWMPDPRPRPGIDSPASQKLSA